MQNWHSINRISIGVVDAPQSLDDTLPTPNNIGQNNTAYSRSCSSSDEAHFIQDSRDSTLHNVENFLPRSTCQSSRGGALQSVSADEVDSKVPAAEKPNEYFSDKTSPYKDELEGVWRCPSSSVSNTRVKKNSSISVLKDAMKPSARFTSIRFHDRHIKPVMPEATRRYTGKPSM